MAATRRFPHEKKRVKSWPVIGTYLLLAARCTCVGLVLANVLSVEWWFGCLNQIRIAAGPIVLKRAEHDELGRAQASLRGIVI